MLVLKIRETALKTYDLWLFAFKFEREYQEKKFQGQDYDKSRRSLTFQKLIYFEIRCKIVGML